MIEFRSVTKRFGGKTAVANLNLTIADGSTTMFVGPSGCGKTTTLKMINRLLDFDEGDLLVQGVSIKGLEPVKLRRTMGYAIQETGLFPHMDVFDNIAVVPRLLGWAPARIRDRVHELLDLVTLDQSFTHKYPLQLSGGEAQRVGLARALAADPPLMLMDEPFGAIDPINRSRLHDLFLSIQDKVKKTIVFVTHDINEAIKLGSHLAVMNHGALVQHGPTREVLAQPADDFVERLLGNDRNLKALILRRCADVVRPDVHLIVTSEVPRSEVESKLTITHLDVAVRCTAAGLLEGLYLPASSGKGVVYVENPTRIDERCDLQEALNLMVSSGELRLAVVDGRGRFRGLLSLETISSLAAGREAL